MKLAFSQIAGFLQSPPATVRAILVYGPDAGLASERSQGLCAKLVRDVSDPFAVTTLSGPQVAEDPARLFDEASAPAFGGGRRLIRLQRASESCAAPLSRFLENPPDCESVIVIEAGDLDKRSKLRALCEGPSPLAAAIPCYVEDARDRIRTINQAFEAAGLAAASDVVSRLAEILPPDRLALRSEIEKLILYVGGPSSSTRVTHDDVAAIIANAGGAEVDDLVGAVFSGDPRRAILLMDHLAAEQTSPVAILRALQRHALRLQLARGHMAGGLSAGEALKKLSPPVFWKMVDPMTRQLSRWTPERLEARLVQLAEAEAACKKSGTPDVALVSQLALSLAARP